MKKLLVILGPTATGKTDLALDLAKEFSGELIACDSRQVYRGLDIGTGKMPLRQVEKGQGWWKINGVKIWMYDVVAPKKQYTVADYVKDASKVIDAVSKRGKLPIIVGGTGLYLKSLLEGLPSLAVPVEKRLREQLVKLTVSQLQQRLKIVSPTRWRKMNQSDRANKRRLIRAIEFHTMYSYKRKVQSPPGGRAGSKFKVQNYDVLKVGLTTSRESLYQKINARVLDWLDQGIVEEVNKLIKSGVSFMRLKALGLQYGLIADYLQGKIPSLDQLTIKMQRKIRQYAKRQLTWFKNPSTSSGYINWFDVSSKNYAQKVEKMTLDWYNESHVNKKS